MDFLETVIDHVGGIGCSDEWCGVSTGEQRVINRLKSLKEKHPDKVECIAENADGSVYYHVPWNWIKITPKRELAEEHRLKLNERGKATRFKGKDGSN